MRSILKRRELVADEWRYLDEVRADIADVTEAKQLAAGWVDALIVPFVKFRAEPASWSAHDGRLGIRLTPVDPVEELAEHLPRLSLVAVEFPGPGDGRGFSQGQLLRSRLHFMGELRAVGAGVKQDLLFLMARCGFDAFELAPGQRLDEALAALERYSVAYQPGTRAPGDALPAIRRQRFFAA